MLGVFANFFLIKIEIILKYTLVTERLCSYNIQVFYLTNFGLLQRR